MSKGYQGKPSVAQPKWTGMGNQFLLITSQRFHALTQYHQRFIDVSCLPEAIASVLSIFKAFGARQVDNGQPRDLGVTDILSRDMRLEKLM